MTDNPSCPGVPDKCEHSRAVISKVLEGMPDMAEAEAARAELGHCLPCVQQVDFQVRFKVAMAQQSDRAGPTFAPVAHHRSVGPSRSRRYRRHRPLAVGRYKTLPRMRGTTMVGAGQQ